MAILTVTSKGQVTIRKNILHHLGVKPGDKIELDLLPDGEAILKAAQPTGSMAGFVGLLAGKSDKVASMDEIKGASAAGWAGKR